MSRQEIPGDDKEIRDGDSCDSSAENTVEQPRKPCFGKWNVDGYYKKSTDDAHVLDFLAGRFCYFRHWNHFADAVISSRRPPRVHKKERIIFLMHSCEALPQAYPEYMKRRRAPRGASSLACRSGIEIVEVFRTNDVLACDAKSS